MAFRIEALDREQDVAKLVVVERQPHERGEVFAVPVETSLIRRGSHMDRPEYHRPRYRRETVYRRTEKRLEWELARAQEDEFSMKAATTILGGLLAGGAIASVVVAFQTMIEGAAGFGSALAGIGGALFSMAGEALSFLITSLVGFIASHPLVGLAIVATTLLTAALSIRSENEVRMKAESVRAGSRTSGS